MQDAATKDKCRFMAIASLWPPGAIRAGGSPPCDGGAAHTATNGHAATVCLDGRHRRRMRLWSFQSGGKNNNPKSCDRNDQSTAEPSQTLLIALVTQKAPDPIFALVLGTVDRSRRIDWLERPRDGVLAKCTKGAIFRFHPYGALQKNF